MKQTKVGERKEHHEEDASRDRQRHGEDRGRHPASRCGLTQTSLRGLSIDWLICLQPAQQNIMVLM